MGRIGKMPLLTAADESALAASLRSALEGFLRHMVGSLRGIESILAIAAETSAQRKRAKSSDGQTDINCIEEACVTELTVARHALASRGWVPADVAARLKDDALRIALGIGIRVSQASRILKDCGAGRVGRSTPDCGSDDASEGAYPVWDGDLLDSFNPEDFWKEAARLWARCIELRNRFVESNLRLVVSAVANMSRPGFSMIDMIQEGNIGLIKAVESFDERKKFKFSTFAVTVIRTEVSRAYSNTGRLIRLPVYQCESLGKIESARKRLEQNLGRTPDVGELARESGLKDSAVEELWGWRNPILSLEAPLGGESDLTLSDTLVDPSSVPRNPATAGVVALVERGLQTLPPVERQLLSLRHGLEGDLPDGIKTAADRLGLSVAIAQALESKAVEHLRRSIRKGPAGFEWNE
jgi:RNA polymerase sigma factor (sigma-70 family)